MKQKCKTKYCRNPPKGRKFCSTCRSRKSRDSNIVRYIFIALRNNAKRRNIPFNITISYFAKFCKKTQYIGRRGRLAHSYSIDRIKNHIGYIPGNIRAITLSDNVKKYFSYDYKTKTAKIY